jgi:hypothetical protein
MWLEMAARFPTSAFSEHSRRVGAQSKNSANAAP